MYIVIGFLSSLMVSTMTKNLLAITKTIILVYPASAPCLAFSWCALCVTSLMAPVNRVTESGVNLIFKVSGGSRSVRLARWLSGFVGALLSCLYCIIVMIYCQ